MKKRKDELTAEKEEEMKAGKEMEKSDDVSESIATRLDEPHYLSS